MYNNIKNTHTLLCIILIFSIYHPHTNQYNYSVNIDMYKTVNMSFYILYYK